VRLLKIAKQLIVLIDEYNKLFGYFKKSH